MSKETISEQGIALLNVLTPRQKEYALTLYSGREKKKSTAYILWLFFAVYYFYLGHPVKNIIFSSNPTKRKNKQTEGRIAFDLALEGKV